MNTMIGSTPHRPQRTLDAMRAICAAASSPILVIDRQFRIAIANDAAVKLCKDACVEGQGAAPLFGKGLTDILRGCMLSQSEVALKTEFNGRLSELTATAFDFDRKPYIAVIIHAERRLRRERMEDVAEAHLKAVELLGRGMSHDLNNMLAVLVGFVDLVSDLPSTPALVAKKAGSVRKSIAAIQGTVTRLVEMGRPLIPDREKIDLDSWLAETAEGFAGSSRAGNIKVEMNCGGVGNVRVDPGLLYQAILNLLINAAEAMPDGGTIHIRTRLYGPSARKDEHLPVDMPRGWYADISVRDTGCGMTEDQRNSVFTPFISTKHTGGGRSRGLGGFMVYRIIKSHGGFVSVRSEVGRGSTYNIYLPVAARGG